MANINYIASAGTGKTYNLVSKVIEKILDENVPLKQILILTFTEKAATELKQEIARRIKELLKSNSIEKQKKVKLHRELIQIDSGYIGTFHSVFLRFLKKYPLKSGIDDSFSILSELDIFLNLSYEKWIERNFDPEESVWKEILHTIGDEPGILKKTVISLYKDRLKIRNQAVDNKLLKKQKQKIKELSQYITDEINEFLEKYKELLEQADKHKSIYRLNPKQVLKDIENGRFLSLPENESIFTVSKSRNVSSKEVERLYKEIKHLRKTDEHFKYLDENIPLQIKKLKTEVYDYNINLLFFKAIDFMKFVKALKQEEKLLDFNDILEKTVELLKDRKIKEDIKSNFKYILIDEFQDTDVIQTEIIKKVSNNNIYVFGDPKQCIYTWRDADLSVYFNFLSENKFKDIQLDKNYRSGKKLVEFYNRLLSGNILLRDINEKFKFPILPHKNIDGKIKLVKLHFKDNPKNTNIAEKEAIYTAFLIKKLFKEGISYKDIMVLFRKNKDMIVFKDILSSFNIPVVSSEDYRLYEKPEIKLLLNILKFIEYPYRKLELLKILKSPLILEDDERLFEKRENFSIDNFSYKNLEVIKEIISCKYQLTVEQIIDRIYRETDILEITSLQKNSKEAVENLKRLKILAKQKTLEGFSLRDFILFIETSDIKGEQSILENSVRLMTMHKSKGLQSKVVILPLLAIEPDKLKLAQIHTYNRELLFNYPKAKSRNLRLNEENIKREIKQEWERLFYVAITRAEEQLILIDNGIRNKDGKPKRHAFINYIEDFIEQGGDDILEIFSKNFEDIFFEEEKHEINIEKIKEELNQIRKKEKIREKIYQISVKNKRFKSVSEIMKEEFKTEEVSFNPAAEKSKNEALYIGITVHNVLENIDFKTYNMRKVKELLECQRELIPENIRENVLKQSELILKRFKNSPLHLELKNAIILFRELPFTLYENENFIEGRIDIIYKKNGKIVVMDYKTNKYETEVEKREIISTYEKQKEYYLKAVKKMFPEDYVEFKLGLLWKGEVI